MGLARELIENGRVPPAEAFTVEGMFSEHDLPLNGPSCSRLLCLRAALGIAPTLEGDTRGWLQVGMSSTINADHFQRPPITLIAVVDVSGSMGWGYSSPDGEYPRPGALSRSLLTAVAAELGSADRIAIVTYGSDVNTLLNLTSGDNRPAIENAIDSLSTNGSTNMEAGLERAYEIARNAGSDMGEVRLMLFTDVQPNVGATSPDSFKQMAQDGADAGIGLTVMAVGVGLGQEVLNAMVNLRGGNAFSLFKTEDVGELMEDDWPWLVSPIAYDLSVELSLPSTFEVAESYGFPGEDPGLQVATVFLSKRKGALLLGLSPLPKSNLQELGITLNLSYKTPENESVTDEIHVAYDNEPLDDSGMFFQQFSVGKTVALAILVSNMKIAAEKYAIDRVQAVSIMQAVVARISADAAVAGNEALLPEEELAQNLLQLMEQGAEQGDLYEYGR